MLPVSSALHLLLLGLGGGLAAVLALVPVRRTSSGFARTITLVALGALLAAQAQDLYFRAAGGRPGLDSTQGHTAALSTLLATLILAAFVAALRRPGEPGRMLPIAAALFGLGALAVTAALIAGTTPPSNAGLEVLAAAQGMAAAGVLGSSLAAMLLGHFYLVVPGLAIEPLRDLTRILVGALLLRSLLSGVALAMVGLPPSGPEPDAQLMAVVLLTMRLMFGLAGPLVLGIMAERTVAIRSTQSATGILYGVVVFVLIGESVAAHLLVRTGVPL